MDTDHKNHRQVLFQKLDKKWYVFAESQDGPVCAILPEGMDPRKGKLELYEILEDHLPMVSSAPLKTSKLKKRPPEGLATS